VESQNTIQEILCETPSDCIRVFDINLRQNYYSELVIDQSLKIASVLKLNDEELPIVGSTFGFTGSDESILSQLLANYNLNLIALTKGAQGSLLFLPTTESILEPTKTKIIDTVGAGDAFTAGLVYGLLNDYDISHIHRIASNLATFVCSKNGATPRLNGEQKKFILNS
jgi:fructokinase